MSDDDDVPADDDEMEWCGSCSQEASGLVHSCLLKRYEPGHITAGPKAGREKEEHWDEHCTNSTENPKHTQQTN